MIRDLFTKASSKETFNKWWNESNPDANKAMNSTMDDRQISMIIKDIGKMKKVIP